MNLDLRISEILKKLGAPAYLSGYKQMKELIKIVYEHDGPKRIKYSEMYRKLCQENETKTAERTLRYLVKIIFLHKDFNEYLSELFRFNVAAQKEPSVREFVEVIVEELRLQERRELYEQEGNKAIKSE